MFFLQNGGLVQETVTHDANCGDSKISSEGAVMISAITLVLRAFWGVLRVSLRSLLKKL
jgi:hypothetical protein